MINDKSHIMDSTPVHNYHLAFIHSIIASFHPSVIASMKWKIQLSVLRGEWGDHRQPLIWLALEQLRA